MTRRRPMKALLAALALLGAAGTSRAAEPPCAKEAVAQAQKLLAWHSEGDDRAAVEPQAKALPPLANPANKAQKLHVLEVTGHVYKANYRMRMLYAASPGPCLLMGQEILELSSF